MDDVEKLQQMSEVERMREVMDVVSDSMHKQNDKDRMEILAMLASTTAMEANLMSVKFAQRAKTANAGNSSTKQKGKAIMKGVEQAENGKDEVASSNQANNSSAQKQKQPNTQPTNTLATRTQQALDKKKRLAGKGTLATVGTLGAV